MLRLVVALLLAIIPLAASNQDSREVQQEILEKIYKPCILHDVNCPPDGSMDYKKLVPTLKMVRGFKPPSECKCDTSAESCVRRCYYAIIVDGHEKSVAAGKTDADDIDKAKKQIRAQLDTYYKPCILEKKNCQVLGDGIKYSDMVTQVKGTVKMYSLPEECDCDIDVEKCARKCIYAYMKQSLSKK